MRIYHITKLIAFLLLSTTLFSCIEKYWPEMDEKYMDLIVVDGMITNLPGPYTIKISKSTSVNYAEYLPLSNFYVEIVDNLGNTESLTEIEDGIYQSSENGMQGVVGRSYKLVINAPDGRTYESSFQKIKEPIEIENVRAVWETKQDTSKLHDQVGYQFYVDNSEFEHDSTFLMWKVEQTYKYKANHVLTYLYYDHIMHRQKDIDSLRVCYITSTIDEFYTFKLLNSKGKSLNDFPLNFVSTEGKDLSLRYSLLVNQMSISSEAYTYLYNLNNQNTGDGSIHFQQPYQLRSNIENINDPNDIVIGYFTVAGVAQKRIFVDRPEDIFYYEGKCFIDLEATAWLHLTVASEWPIYFTPDSLNFEGIVPRECVDCRASGGKLEVPSFWVGGYDPE